MDVRKCLPDAAGDAASTIQAPQEDTPHVWLVALDGKSSHLHSFVADIVRRREDDGHKRVFACGMARSSEACRFSS
jgi:NAD(P)H-flavin reductase